MEPTGDLRVGSRFSFEGNAGGEILRCEPPRRLTVTWVYGEPPGSQVELRLTPGEAGDTVLELEHFPVAEQVELDGRLVDPVLNDPETGIWVSAPAGSWVPSPWTATCTASCRPGPKPGRPS
jgi:hypothetical protein